MQLELPRWYDLHAHFRQGAGMASFIKDHLKMGCAGVLAMPNTKPPVAKVFRDGPETCWSIEEYTEMLEKAGGAVFKEIIVPLYLTEGTSPAMIEEGVESGVLQACKYYPPHGTTGAEFGRPLATFMENGVFKAMEECGVILCVHGEEHRLREEDYFARNTSAEAAFYKEAMPRLADACPGLRVAAEHVTTKEAVDFVRQAGNAAATVTPQHLLYTAGHLLKGFKYHLYCLPLVKFEEDRQALRDAVTAADNTKFFAGTDSAPHTNKITPCGCAAGCYTGGIAPQLYAQAFEEAGADFSQEEGKAAFERFLCRNGPAFYGLEVPEETFVLIRKQQAVTTLETPEGSVAPLPSGMTADGRGVLNWSVL